MRDSVIITGAGTGLGLETALYLANQGFRVYATIPEASQREHVVAEAERCQTELQVLLLDVTDPASIQAAVDKAVQESGGISGLINNAGISLRGYFEDLDEDEIRRTFAVNLFGAMAVTRAVLPYMRQAKRGRIVFMSSIGARMGSMARTAYCSSKSALEGFAEALYQEVTPFGIHISVIEPAIINTERWTVNRGIARHAQDPEGPYYTWFQREEHLADALVRSSPTTPQDVAQTVYAALTATRPRMRYVVGRRARLVLALRRYIPGEIFERIYWGEAIRRITGSRRPMQPAGEKPVAGAVVSKQQAPAKGFPTLRSLLKIVKVLGLPLALQANRAKKLSEETVRGYYVTRTIAALINIGLLDEMTKQKMLNLEEFAKRKNLDITVLQPLCEYLYALRYFNRQDGNYALTSKGRLAARTPGAFTVVYAYEECYYNLEDMLTKQKKYGVNVHRRGKFVATGSGSVGKLLAFPMVEDALKQHSFNNVLDLGCGDAAFLRDLVKRNRNVTGYGVDISPESVAAGQRQLDQEQLTDRIHLMVGNIFHLDKVADQLKNIDATTSIYVMHEFFSESKEVVVELLHKFRSTFPGVPLVICEVINESISKLHEQPSGILEVQFFHALSKQYLFTRDQWKDVFREAGFTNIEEEYLQFAKTAIFTIS